MDEYEKLVSKEELRWMDEEEKRMDSKPKFCYQPISKEKLRFQGKYLATLLTPPYKGP